MIDKLPAALTCPVDFCMTLTAIGTVDTMCQRHWNMLAPKTRWRIYDATEGPAFKQRQKEAVDEANEKRGGR